MPSKNASSGGGIGMSRLARVAPAANPAPAPPQAQPVPLAPTPARRSLEQAPSPSPVASPNTKRWAKEFANVWGYLTTDTAVEIKFKPIPASVEAVFKLTPQQKELLDKARKNKKSSFDIEVHEEISNVYFYINDGTKQHKIHAMVDNNGPDREPWRREEPEVLEKLAKKFILIMKKICNSPDIPARMMSRRLLNQTSTRDIGSLRPLPQDILAEIESRIDPIQSYKVLLEAAPSDRSVDHYGEQILRNVYGKFLVSIGVDHAKIKMRELEYDYATGDYVPKTIRFNQERRA